MSLASNVLEEIFASVGRLATLSAFFKGVKDESELNIVDVRERVSFQRDDGKQMEIDVRAKSREGRVVLVEVKKRQAKTGLTPVEDFWDKVEAYGKRFPDEIILPAFLSSGGFTEEALQFCKRQGIGTAESIAWRIGE